MNVLITGISGLLGSLVAEDAYKAGYTVFGVSRNRSNQKCDFPITQRIQDLSAPKFDTELLAGMDVIIHCAAETSMGSINDPYQDLINISAVKKLVDASLRSDVKRFIFVSSVNTLRPGNSFNPGTEKNKLHTSSANLNYINSKISAENIIQDAVKNRGLNAVIINPTFIINPLAGDMSSNKLLKYALSKSILFYPQGSKNIVDARDVSKAIIVAIDKGVSGENYIISNRNYSYKDIFKLAKKVRKRNAIYIPIPRILLFLTGGFMSIVEWFLRKPMNFNLKSARLLNSSHICYSSRKAMKALDLSPIHLVETIKTKLKFQIST